MMKILPRSSFHLPRFPLLASLGLLCCGCSHRQSNVVASAPRPAPAPPPMLAVVTAPPRTFKASGIQFDYPGDWQPTKGQTALFAVNAPGYPVDSLDCPSLSLDVPKLPWHIPGMITCGMVSGGYVDDLRKNLIPDAVVQEERSMTIAGERARKLTCSGHRAGKPYTDIAVILVHSDHVYIFSADSGETGCDCARKTLDAAVASMKWAQ